jgi:hypothetical protein
MARGRWDPQVGQPPGVAHSSTRAGALARDRLAPLDLAVAAGPVLCTHGQLIRRSHTFFRSAASRLALATRFFAIARARDLSPGSSHRQLGLRRGLRAASVARRTAPSRAACAVPWPGAAPVPVPFTSSPEHPRVNPTNDRGGDFNTLNAWAGFVIKGNQNQHAHFESGHRRSCRVLRHRGDNGDCGTVA